MAIAPNTTFVSGAILTAAQMNALPWGVHQLTTITSDTALTTTEVVVATASFTAVASRLYRITYTEGDLFNANGSTALGCIARIREGTTTGGTEKQFARVNLLAGGEGALTTVFVGTLTAGPISVVGTLIVTAGTGTAFHTAARPAQLTVEDIGPS